MKRKIFTVLFLIIVISFALAGCGNKANDIDSTEPNEEIKEETKAEVSEPQKIEEIKSLELIEEVKIEQDEIEPSITNEDFLISKEFDKEVGNIVLDDSKGVESQIEEAYEAIQNIIDNAGLDIKYVKKVNNGVIVKFSSGIKYYYTIATDDVLDGTGTLHVSTQQPFYSAGLRHEHIDEIANNIEKAVENAVFDLNIDDSQVTYDMLHEIFAPNKVVIWDGHGGWDEENNSYFLPLGLNSWDAVEGNEFLERAAEKEQVILTTDGRMAITAELIYGMNIDATNSMIYLNTCYSMRDSEFASALVNGGADLVCGYTNSVSVKYAEALLQRILDEMCVKGEGGYTDFVNACLTAMAENGSSDPYCEEQAEPCYLGNCQYRFDDAIEKIIEEPEEEYLDPLDDGAYTTYDTPTVEDPTIQEMPVFTQARIEDGELIINASFEQWDENWTTCTSYPYGLRKMKISDSVVIQHSGGIEAPEKDTAEGFNEWYSDLEAPNRLDHAGLSLYIIVENGEVVLIDIGS